MDLYKKEDGSFDDDAWKDDIKRNKSLYWELYSLGIRYDFENSWWELFFAEQAIWRKDLLELIVVELSNKDADVENLRRTWPEVHRIREEGRDAFKSMNLETEQLESLYKQLHDRWLVVQQIQNLGRQAGIDMTMDVLSNLEKRVE